MESEEVSNSVYIAAACRTAIGSIYGQFSKIPATTLGAIVIRQCLKESEISSLQVSEVIMGQVVTAGQGLNPARHSAFKANIPVKVPVSTVNMGWGSGLRAVYQGYHSILCGNARVVICGGQENVTMARHSVSIRENQDNQESFAIKDTLLVDGLTDGFTGLHLGKIAGHVARTYKISREEQDIFAYESQMKSANATENLHFFPEIVSDISTDEPIKPSTTIEQLFHMPALYEQDLEKHPSVTAGNSFAVGDGAAVVLLCNDEYRLKRCLTPLAKIVAFIQTGFEISDTSDDFGPADAIEKVIEAANWTVDQVDLFEINESFAAQVLVIMKKLELDPKKINKSGGAIALGDPPGASGARMLVTLIHNLRRLRLTRGIAYMWIGEGMSLAIAIEVVDWKIRSKKYAK